MPWCPKCKTEYREGILRCTDCGSPLVDQLSEDMICIMMLPEETAHDLLAYYEYLGVDYSILEFDRESGRYRVLIPKSKEQEIQKPTADYFAKLDKEPSKEPAPTAAPRSQAAYRGSKERLDDTKSSAFSFLIVGGVGILAVILILAGILPFPFAASGRTLTLSVMGLLFLIFFVIGILNLRRLKTLKADVSQEDALTGEIRSWFLSSYTKETVDGGCELDTSEEINYYRRTEYMKRLIRSKYALEENYLDSVTEDLYASLYEQEARSDA